MPAIPPRILLSLLLSLPALPALAAKTGNTTNTRALAFGSFVAATGGTITLSTAGARSKTGGVVLISGGTVSSASFSLTESGSGKSGNFTNITLPGSATLTRAGGGTMTLNTFVSDPPTTVLGTGRTVVLVGAKLTVGANQAVGNYSGTFPVTVNYQ